MQAPFAGRTANSPIMQTAPMHHALRYAWLYKSRGEQNLRLSGQCSGLEFPVIGSDRLKPVHWFSRYFVLILLLGKPSARRPQ
jgi:hypothetical protein